MEMEKTHAEKLKEAGIRKYGTEEKWRQALREGGAKADRTTPRGFAKIDQKRRSEISSLGGKAKAAKEKARRENSTTTRKNS